MIALDNIFKFVYLYVNILCNYLKVKKRNNNIDTLGMK